jgi:hypothetical protein
VLPHPGGIVRFACGCAVGAGFENLLMAEGKRFFNFKHEARWIPPHDWRPARDWVMQAGFNRTSGGDLTLATAIQHRVRTEDRTADGR